MKLTSKNTKAELLWATESLNRRIRELEAELADARRDSARVQTALRAAMVVLSGQETSKSMLVRALELGQLAMKVPQ